jgi:DNA replication and repair protein RecF
MQLRSLFLYNFRNYKEAFLSFSEKLNVICGENAQGKTNLLESVHFLITGRSFRTHHLTDLIRFEAEEFLIEAHFIKNNISQVLKISSNGEQRKMLHNATSLPTLSSLFGIVNGVILSPKDNELIKGAPAYRRQFLDIQISQTNPFYLYHLSRYGRALKQRNALLRKRQLHSIEIWEEELAKSAAYIVMERKKAALELETEATAIQKILSSKKDHLNLIYKCFAFHRESTTLAEVTAFYLSQYAKARKKELDVRVTLVGPHKDDLHIFLNEKEARFFASEGQLRTAVTALKLAEWQRLKNITEEPPLFCIDDVGISLDAGRHEELFRFLSHLGQVFLTSPHHLSLPHPAVFFQISQGNALQMI